MTEATSALAKVAELIKSQDDLENISAIRERFVKEKTAIDVHLRAAAQTQVEDSMNGLAALNSAKVSISELKKNLAKVNKIADESFGSVQDYKVISDMSKIHDNFTESLQIYDSLRTLHDDIDYCKQLILEDGEFHLSSPMPNLLSSHYHLIRLRYLEDKLNLMAASASEDTRRTVTRHFLPLQHVVQLFEDNLADIAGGLLEIVRENNQSLVIRVAKMLDYEEKEDLKTRIINDIYEKQKEKLRKEFRGGTTGQAKAKELSKHFHGRNLTERRTPYGYKEKFFQALQLSVQETFANCQAAFGDDLFSLLDNLDWIFNDLFLVKQELTALVPSRWDIFTVMYELYHGEAQKMIFSLLARPEIQAQELLRILEFDKTYCDVMHNELGIPREEVKDSAEPGRSREGASLLLGGKKIELLDEYLQLLVRKMQEWLHNITETETREFLTRDSPPEVDADGFLGLKGANLVFKMFSQQAEVAADSGQARILAGVIREFSGLLTKRQESWSTLVQSEITRQLEYDRENSEKTKRKSMFVKFRRNNSELTPDDSGEFPGGLIEYLIAFANDQIKSADYTEAVLNKCGNMVSKKYRGDISAALNRLIDGYAALAKECVDGLIKIVFSDLAEPFRHVFGKKWHHTEQYTVQIRDTLLDYLQEFQESLNPYLFEVLVEDVLDATVVNYVACLKPQHHKMDSKSKSSGPNVSKSETTVAGLALSSGLSFPACVEAIKRDVGMLYDFFVQYTDPSAVQLEFRIFEHLLDLLEIDLTQQSAETEKQLTEKYEEILNDYWDCPVAFIEYFVKAARRGHRTVDSKWLAELLAECRAVSREVILSANSGDRQPTYMGKFLKI